ncbi:cytochrome P450 4C1 [Agrilus planipennis]|uniref:Cytochrome P450 4C1 n=1 Tax=Agrilus planipennis TaxID=224129 RepID=A0A7F5RJF6_AGRPL|nr:cytochrome P450 4C1 [Agrilus planipennis]
MDPILLILALVVIGIIYFLKEDPTQKEIAEAVERFPGPKRYPIVGTNFSFLLKPKEEIFLLIAERVKKFGSPHKAWMGKLPMINLNTPEDVELILNNSVQIKKGYLYKFIQPWLLDGLLTSYGAYWHKNRKLITPTFHFSILEQFVEIFDEKSRILVSKLMPQANGQVFNVYPNITHCALDIICETAMGVAVNAMDKPNSEYVSAVYGISKLATDRAFLPWYHSDFIFYRTAMGKQFLKYVNILHGFTEKVIKERKGKLADTTTDQEIHEDEEFIGKKKRKAFLDMLLEASKGGTIMNDLEIRQEVDTFMFEGHDTTTAAICWTLFLIGNNPDIQEKAFKEQEEIFHGEDRPVTMKDLGEMKYLERVIKETLRLYPSVPFISRLLTEELVVSK